MSAFAGESSADALGTPTVVTMQSATTVEQTHHHALMKVARGASMRSMIAREASIFSARSGVSVAVHATWEPVREVLEKGTLRLSVMTGERPCKFRVIAYNAAGDGRPSSSSPFTFSTLAARPSDFVIDLAATPLPSAPSASYAGVILSNPGASLGSHPRLQSGMDPKGAATASAKDFFFREIVHDGRFDVMVFVEPVQRIDLAQYLVKVIGPRLVQRLSNLVDGELVPDVLTGVLGSAEEDAHDKTLGPSGNAVLPGGASIVLIVIDRSQYIQPRRYHTLGGGNTSVSSGDRRKPKIKSHDESPSEDKEVQGQGGLPGQAGANAPHSNFPVMYIASVGVTKTILSRGEHPVFVSGDHEPIAALEQDRVFRAGGTVVALGRGGCIQPGGLTFSRIIGCVDYKRSHPGVLSAEPTVRKLEVSSPPDAGFLIASAAFWNLIRPEDVFNAFNRDHSTASGITATLTHSLRQIGYFEEIAMVVANFIPFGSVQMNFGLISDGGFDDDDRGFDEDDGDELPERPVSEGHISES